MKRLLTALALLALVPLAEIPGQDAHRSYAERRDYTIWEKEVAAYESADRENPPPKDGILFIGSSTIRLWKTLADDFPDHKVINRGFGGTEIVDSTHFADRLIFPHRPKQIFLRQGATTSTPVGLRARSQRISGSSPASSTNACPRPRSCTLPSVQRRRDGARETRLVN